MAAAIKEVEQAAALEEAAKGTQEEWEKALDLFGEYLTGERVVTAIQIETKER